MADLDLAELRRLAENATDYPAARDLDGWGWEMARTADNPLGDQVRLYFDPPQVRYVAAVPPDVVLALLDRLEAAEVWDYGARVGLHNDLSYAEGTVVGYDLHRRRYKVEVDGYGRTEWVPRSQLRPLPPSSAAVPGAVAGELRGRAEAQAAVIARYRDGWVENHTDSEPNGTWWHPPRGEVEPMTDAERQVLYPAGPQPTEGTTP